MDINGAGLNGATLNGRPASILKQAEVITLAAGCRWRLRVLLDGQDISARLTNTLKIDREEGAARLVNLALVPMPGALDLDGLTGKPLQIFRQRLDGGTVQAEQLRFTGTTLRPAFNATSQVIGLTATCDLQNRIEQMSIEQINALIPGYYAEAVFGEVSSHYKYAQDRCSTVLGNVECAPDGSLRVSPWAPAAVAHFSFGPSEVLDGSIEVQPADAGQLINQVEITLEYRYTRLRHRQHGYTWEHPAGSFCVWLGNDTELPTESMLRDALDQGGWQIIGTPTLDKLPGTMPDPCGQGGVWINSYTADPHLLGFGATVARRTAQTLTEHYLLTLEASGSVASFGTHPSRERYSDEVEFDSGSWEDLAPDSTPADAVQDELGDWVIDKDDLTRRDNALITALRVEWVRMAASHRQTRVAFQAPITDQVYDTVHTARVAALGTVAQGKVARIQEVWDLNSGSEIAILELAIYRGGVATPGDPLTPPARPPFALGDAPPTGTVLATQLGGAVGSPPYDEELDGFAGNYGWEAAGSQTYPRRLQLTTPDIEALHRDPAEAETAASYAISLPTDLLLTEVI